MSNRRWRYLLGLPEGRKFEEYELDTITRIRNQIPELSHLSAEKLAMLWERFSSDQCSGWLNGNDESLKEFWEWCTEEIYVVGEDE